MIIRAIGSVAADLLAESHNAFIQGKTSKGVFLRLDPGWVVFVSREGERGPLTLNINNDAGYLDSLSIGSQLRIATTDNYSPNDIFSSHTTGSVESLSMTEVPLIDQTMPAGTSEVGSFLLFDIHQAQIWQAPPRPANTLPAGERLWTVAAMVKQALKINPAPSLVALQAVCDGSINGPDGDAGHFFPHLARISDQLLNRQQSISEAIRSPLQQLDLHSFSSLVGLGRGLTPSGDDILLGLLLALNRWRSVLSPFYDVVRLNREILSQAYQDTTIISANLIECATRGQADERLITALDSLMTGEPGTEKSVAMLAGWGSSSGFDALCGMALAIRSARR